MAFGKNLTYGTQLCLPNTLEKIDPQFRSCESFAFFKCRSIGNAPGRIGYVTKDTAMKYTRRIGMLFTALEFNRREPNPDQLSNRW